MADKTYYAWSPIQSAKAEEGKPSEFFSAQPGDTVTAAKLGLDKDQFQALIDAGSVREQSYPDVPAGYQDSPVNFLRAKALEAAGDSEEAALALGLDTLNSDTPQASPTRTVGGAGSPS